MPNKKTRASAPPGTTTPLQASLNTPLRIDSAHLYQTSGVDGVDQADLNAIAERLEDVHRSVTERSRGGLDAEFACLNLHDSMPASLPHIQDAATAIRKFQDVLVIGIGGSSLGVKAGQQALTSIVSSDTAPRLHFLENIDPDHIANTLARLQAENTALICISKSGGTIETVTQYLVVRDWLEQRLGRDQARQQQWLVTDPKQGWLREIAEAEKIPALEVPPKVGGRYSVLTAVGLLPLAANGVDVQALLQGSADNAARCRSAKVGENPALEMAVLFYLLDTRKTKRISIMMPYVQPLQLFGEWYCQLWAESLGKCDPGGTPAGTLPVRAMGAVDQHSQLQMYLESRLDKIFTFIALDHWRHTVPIPLPEDGRKSFPYIADKSLNEVLQAEFLATRDVITETGHPNMTIHLPVLSAHTLGQLIDLYQRATVYAGLLYDINPLDQPAVEKGKRLTRQYLGGGNP